MSDWKTVAEAMVTEAADLAIFLSTWHSAACRLAAAGRFPAFYLYYRESTAREYGALYLVPEDVAPDPSWKLGDANAYRAGMTREQVRKRVREAAWSLPIIPSHLDAV